jgi:hypothetical protein
MPCSRPAWETVGIHIIAMKVAEGLSPLPTGECSRNPVARRAVISRKFFLALRESVETSVQNPTIKKKKIETEEILQRREGEIGTLRELSRVLDANHY